MEGDQGCVGESYGQEDWGQYVECKVVQDEGKFQQGWRQRCKFTICGGTLASIMSMPTRYMFLLNL